jgi:ankyrin repeat protein
MAYQNNPASLQSSLRYGAKYIKDSFGNTPLEYAMERNSFECTKVVLDYIMSTENIFKTMEMQEITKLIETSSSNLLEFFN